MMAGTAWRPPVAALASGGLARSHPVRIPWMESFCNEKLAAVSHFVHKTSSAHAWLVRDRGAFPGGGSGDPRRVDHG